MCLVYALENVVDFLSTVVVLWRFFAPTSLDDALEQKLRQREQRASVAISFIMVALGISIIASSLADFARGQEDTFQEGAVLVMSFLSVMFFGVLSTLKFRYAARLDSPSMYKDGICSLLGTVLGVALFVNTIVVAKHPGAWWIDPSAACVAGVVAILLGVRALWDAYANDGIPIFSKSWWFSQKENEVPKNHTVDRPDNTEAFDDVEDVDIV